MYPQICPFHFLGALDFADVSTAGQKPFLLPPCPPGDNARAQDTSNEDAKGVRRTNGAEVETEEEEEEEDATTREKTTKHDVELDKGLRVDGEEVGSQ